MPPQEQIRTQTGIPGLDEMLDGGFLKASSILVSGGCGCGKTTLSMQYLVNGVREFGEHGVFVSFTESPETLKRDMASFEWGIKELESAGSLSVLRLDPQALLQVIREDYGEIRDVIKDTQATRLVIDPISTFNIIVENMFERKMSLLKFCEWLKKNKCTAILTSEVEKRGDFFTESGFEEFVVDCVLVMYNIQIKNSRQNALEVLKMRGSSHSKKIAPFVFDKKGISVSPEEKLFWDVDQ
ncbi:MAG: AAA family ATPase [Candidatus Altiarchaeales archaeon]|nr:AAA family ATPase [Candidatus Altiarchaeales archaeon]